MKRECLKGWILAPSPTDGVNVPFFVYVRDKDIKYDAKNVSNQLNELYLKGENGDILYPVTDWKFDMNGWRVSLTQDGVYEAKRKIEVSEVFTFKNSPSTTLLEYTTQLPFETKDDDEFHVQLTLSTNIVSFASSSLTFQVNENKDIIDSINIDLVNTFYGFEDVKKYKDSYVYVTVSGRLSIKLDK